MYVHVMLLVIPQVLRLRTAYVITFIVYTAVFLSYLICRLLKASARRHKTEPALFRKEIIAFSISLAAALAAGLSLYFAVSGQNNAKKDTAVSTEAIEAETGSVSAEAIEAETESVSAESSDNYEENEPKKSDDNADEADTDASYDQNPGTDAAIAQDFDADAAQESYKYKNGTYTGTAFGYEGDISVTVSIENDCITEIYFAEYYDDPDYEEDGASMLKRIYAAQSDDSIVTDVDVISGATFTSKGVLGAFTAALEEALN